MNQSLGRPQDLCFSEDTALSLATPNCRKCSGRGSYLFQKTVRSGVFGDLRKQYCGCVEKKLKEKVNNVN